MQKMQTSRHLWENSPHLSGAGMPCWCPQGPPTLASFRSHLITLIFGFSLVSITLPLTDIIQPDAYKKVFHWTGCIEKEWVLTVPSSSSNSRNVLVLRTTGNVNVVPQFQGVYLSMTFENTNLSIHWSLTVLCLRLRSHGLSLFHVIMSIGVVHVLPMFRQPCLYDFISIASGISGRQDLTANSLFLWPVLPQWSML